MEEAADVIINRVKKMARSIAWAKITLARTGFIALTIFIVTRAIKINSKNKSINTTKGQLR